MRSKVANTCSMAQGHVLKAGLQHLARPAVVADLALLRPTPRTSGRRDQPGSWSVSAGKTRATLAVR